MKMNNVDKIFNAANTFIDLRFCRDGDIVSAVLTKEKIKYVKKIVDKYIEQKTK